MRLAALSLAALAGSAALTSCAAVVAGGAAAYIINEEYLPTGFQETRLDLDVDLVWAAANEGMELLSTQPVQVSDFPRRLNGVVRSRDVAVEVQALDLNQTLLRVSAKKLIGYDEHTAGYVTNYILRRVRTDD